MRLEITEIFFFVTLVTLVYSKPTPLDDDMLLFWRRSGDRCLPFSTYMEKCNKCVCSSDGVPYCTRMECVHNDQISEKNQINTSGDASDMRP